MKLMRGLTLLLLLVAVAGIHADDKQEKKGPAGLLKLSPDQLLQALGKNKTASSKKTRFHSKCRRCSIRSTRMAMASSTRQSWANCWVS